MCTCVFIKLIPIDKDVTTVFDHEVCHRWDNAMTTTKIKRIVKSIIRNLATIINIWLYISEISVLSRSSCLNAVEGLIFFSLAAFNYNSRSDVSPCSLLVIIRKKTEMSLVLIIL